MPKFTRAEVRLPISKPHRCEYLKKTIYDFGPDVVGHSGLCKKCYEIEYYEGCETCDQDKTSGRFLCVYNVFSRILGEISCTECRNPPFGTQYYNTTNDCRDKCILDSNQGCSNFKVCTFTGEFTECVCPVTG